jgi:hypothetical protein
VDTEFQEIKPILPNVHTIPSYIVHLSLFNNSWLCTHQTSRRVKAFCCHHHQLSNFIIKKSYILGSDASHTKRKKEKEKKEKKERGGPYRRLKCSSSSRSKLSTTLPYSCAEWLIELLPMQQR